MQVSSLCLGVPFISEEDTYSFLTTLESKRDRVCVQEEGGVDYFLYILASFLFREDPQYFFQGRFSIAEFF